MTAKTRADLLTEAAANFNDNTAGDISAADSRTMAQDLADSAYNVLTDGVAGWQLVTSQQPTTDVTTVTFTGLSGYRHIKIVFVYYSSTTGDTSPTLQVSGRVSAGTYRDFAARIVGSSANSSKIVMGTIELTNFNTTDIFKIMDFNVDSVSGSILDNTNNISNTNAPVVSSRGLSYASYQEIWDDIKLTASVGIEGGTTANRGYFYVFGMI